MGFKITVNCDSSYQIKRHLLLGRKALTKLDSALKNKEVTFLTKFPMVKTLTFQVFMYGCKSWIVKKAEYWRIDAFELWFWSRLLRVSWTARTSNKSVLKKINHEYSLEGLMLKLKLQYFGHLTRSADSLEKTLKLGKIEGRKRRGWQDMRWLDSFMDSMDMNLSKLQEIVKDRKAWYASVHGVQTAWKMLAVQRIDTT